MGERTADAVAETVAELVQLPSVNPLQAGERSGPGGEQAVAEWLADRADAAGADVTIDPVINGRSNVYARFEGASDGNVTIDVHMDTVGVEHMTRDPFDGAIEDGRLYGRGAVDTKATLAVVLCVLEELEASGRRPGPTVNLVGTVSEEIGGLLGAVRYGDWIRSHGQHIDQLIVAEPTNCAPVHGHKGGVGLEITIRGHAAHSSKPHLGQNAVTAAGRVIVAMEAEQARLSASVGETVVGTGTVAVTEVQGGLARNIIPDCCTLYTGRRLVPGEDPDVVFAQLSALASEAAAPLELDISMPYGHGFPAFYQDPHTPLVERLEKLASAPPEAATYGSNALMYGGLADEIVVFGPGSIDQAHQAVEWIEISELERATAIYRALLT